ncbi:hypothetical protein GGR55DRAFT_673099 [Xylaria sp. FL0064]|nr:hypothetical protein GGR55DRAFT_673099 [Xylaria sp. FL0064]
MAAVVNDFVADRSRFHNMIASSGLQHEHSHSRDSSYRSEYSNRPREAQSHKSRSPAPSAYARSSAQSATPSKRPWDSTEPINEKKESPSTGGASRFPSPPDSSSSNPPSGRGRAQDTNIFANYMATDIHHAASGIGLATMTAQQQPSPESNTSNSPTAPSPAYNASAPQQGHTIVVRDLAHIQSLARADLMNGGNGPGILNDPPLQAMKYEISGMPIGDIIEMVAALLTKITTTNDLQHDALHRNATHQQTAANHNNDGSSMSPLSSSVLAFHGKNVPAITILSYLSRIHKYCPTTYEVFLSLLVYFDRMTERVNNLVMEAEEMRRKQQTRATSSASTKKTDIEMRDAPAGNEAELELVDEDHEEKEGGNKSDLANSPATYFVVDSFNIHRLIIAGVTCASKFFSDVFYTNSRYAKVGGLPLAELNHLELQFLLLNDFRLCVPVEDLEAYATMLVEFYAREVVAQRAGPSGLVAAKTLLYDAASTSFKVTIFDSQQRIGGLWPAHKSDNASLIHPLMVANQSKHTVQFSDFAWRDSDPDFPRAWQIGRYLERYLKEYGGADIRLGHRVVKAELQDGGSWKVQTDSEKGLQTSIFDYLLVATGFFGSPLWPEGIPREGEVPIIHSSKYRDIESLLSKAKDSGDKILVVGGQMSGVEIAGTIATHLSSLIHSPGHKAIQNPERFMIHHITPRPAWTVPLFTSVKPDTPAPPFLPCDLPSYNLALRPHPLVNNQGHISVEMAHKSNSIYQSVLGTDQSVFSPVTKIDGELLDQPPYLAIGMHYMDFVRSGLIKPRKGRLSRIGGDTVTISSEGSEESITNVAAVVVATGFDPSPSISFLPPSVSEVLSHSPAHPDLPVALAFHGTHHPTLPTLGFVGFYRSPYWGVMEMQARFVTHLFQEHAEGKSSTRLPSLDAALASDDSIQRTLALRDDPRCSQFPMGDYAFLMQEFANALGLSISAPIGTTPLLANGRPMDILTPARYVSHGASEAQREQAAENLKSTHRTALAGLTGRSFIAAAVFRSLLGEWSLERDLVSKLPSHPSGRFVGTAKFLLRTGTADGREHRFSDTGSPKESDAAADASDMGLEYLYIEDGEFAAAGTSMRFRATRRYVWRYDEGSDKLSVWFARTDDQMRADYLFHELEFIPPPSLAADGTDGGQIQVPAKDTRERRNSLDARSERWYAKASHLCVEDLYDVHYDFMFKAVNLQEWKLGYSVHGPKKDYTINGTYRRKAAAV